MIVKIGVHVYHSQDICDPDGLHLPKSIPSIVTSAYSDDPSKSVNISSTFTLYISFASTDTYPLIKGPLVGELVAKT